MTATLARVQLCQLTCPLFHAAPMQLRDAAWPQVGFGTAAAPQGRFLLHAATATSAPPAGHSAGGGAAAGLPPGLRDVQEALAALVRLPTAQQQQQQQQHSSQQPDEAPSLPDSGRPAAGGTTEAGSRPSVLLLASWVQATAAVPEVSMHQLARRRSISAVLHEHTQAACLATNTDDAGGRDSRAC